MTYKKKARHGIYRHAMNSMTTKIIISIYILKYIYMYTSINESLVGIHQYFYLQEYNKTDNQLLCKTTNTLVYIM